MQQGLKNLSPAENLSKLWNHAKLNAEKIWIKKELIQTEEEVNADTNKKHK